MNTNNDWNNYTKFDSPEIVDLLKTFAPSQQGEILKRAWGFCCDGEAIENVYGKKFDFDPWDGEHEDERIDIEADAVKEIISFGDLDD